MTAEPGPSSPWLRHARATLGHAHATLLNVVRGARANPRDAVLSALVFLGLAVAAVFLLAPLYWLLSAALRPPGSISVPPSLLPPAVTSENLSGVLAETAFARYFLNSVVVSTATVVATVVIATPAGYSLSRFSIPYRRTVMGLVLVVQMIPLLALITPLYRVFAVAGLLDSLAVVVLTDTIFVVPIGVWLIKGYFDTLPRSLEEAALVGGATRWQAFRAVVPLARPAIGAAALYAFVVSWNQFVIPLTFTSSQAAWTFPVGLYEFISRRGVVNWPLLGAASLWAMVPIVVLVVVYQRQFLAGLAGRTFDGGLR